MDVQLLTYGLKDGKLAYIADVPNGIACTCLCPKCLEPLVAKNNPSNKKAVHFAHNSDSNCTGAYETALHILAKEVIEEIKSIYTPNFHHDYNNNNTHSYFKEGREIKFEEIQIEQKPSISSGEVIADAIGIINGKELILEFANTHFIDNEKTGKLLKLNLPCIEIDLSNQTLDRKALKEFLLSSTRDIYWICNPRLNDEYKEHLKNLEQTEKQQKMELDTNNIKQQIDHSHDKIEAQSIKQPTYSSQRELEERSRKRYENYQRENKYQFYTRKDGAAHKCPIITDELAKLKERSFYRHPILKQIIEGEFWNGKLYGRTPWGCYIFFKGEKVFIYPPDSERASMTEEQEQESKLFFAGAKFIEKILEDAGWCGPCMYEIDWLSFNGRDLTVCSYQHSKSR